MVLEKKGSARVEAGQRRVLDEATRQRRLTRQLEALEKDNFQDDPLSSLPPPGPTARLPAFSETEEPGETRETGNTAREGVAPSSSSSSFLSLCVQRRRRGRRGAITSSSVSGKTSPPCWRRRTCRRSQSRTTCLPPPRPPLCPPVTSAASAGSPLTTPAPPAGGATAAASVCVHTVRPGV